MALFFDRTPVTIAYTVHGQVLESHVTADDVKGNLTLWRRLHLAEWNQIPDPLRRQGLDADPSPTGS